MRRASPAGRGRRRDPLGGGASATLLPACNSPRFAAASAVGFPASLAAGTDLRPAPAAAGRGSAPGPEASAGSSSPPGDLGRVQIEGVWVWFLSHSPHGSTHFFLWEERVGRTSRQASAHSAAVQQIWCSFMPPSAWPRDRRVAHIYRSRRRGGAEGVIRF
jgi:hypothetical protein